MTVNDKFLQDHLELPEQRHVTYMAGHTHNEVIEILGKHMVLKQIVEEIRSAPYYTILADEVESHNVEYLAICVRFVDKHSNVREEFLAFITLNRITG